MNTNPTEQENTRNPDGTFKKGVSGNPGGRPRNTLKDYLARKFSEMSDEEKETWLGENKVAAEIQWRMAEGNPKQDVDADITVQGPSLIRVDE